LTFNIRTLRYSTNIRRFVHDMKLTNPRSVPQLREVKCNINTYSRLHILGETSYYRKSEKQIQMVIKSILIVFLSLLLNPLQAEEFLDYYPNGKLHYQFHKQNNALHGSYVYWHPNGHKAIEGNFKKGKRIGIWKAWYDNGNQLYERTFINGEEQGITSYWYENGVKQVTGEYFENMRHGKWQIWNTNGSKRAEGNCKLNSFHGDWKFWEKNTVLILPFHFGKINFHLLDLNENLWDRTEATIISESFMSIDQKLGDEIRFIFRMNCMESYILERDFDNNLAYNGMFNFRTLVYQGEQEICGDKMSGEAFNVVSQTAEFTHGVKDGNFNINNKSIIVQASYNNNWDTTLITQFTQNVYYKNNSIIDKCVTSSGSLRCGGKKPYKEIKSYSAKTHEIRKVRIHSSHNDSANIDSVLRLKYGLCKPIFEPYQTQDSVLINDTIYFKTDYIEKYVKIPYFVIEHYLAPPISNLENISYLTSKNTFKVMSYNYEGLIMELNFIKDPLFLNFYISSPSNNRDMYYLNGYILPKNPKMYKIPYNHLIHGDVIIYVHGKPTKYYLFDYGFLKEYKEL